MSRMIRNGRPASWLGNGRNIKLRRWFPRRLVVQFTHIRSSNAPAPDCERRTQASQGFIARCALATVALSLSACQLQQPAETTPATPPLAEAAPAERVVAPETAPQPPPQRAVPVIQPQLSMLVRGPATIWEALRSNFSLNDYSDHKSVQQQIKWLQRHPLTFKQHAEAFARYMPYIEAKLRQGGIPGELALMPVIESALDPYAFSPGGAAGLWQFIDVTADRFGLRRDWWYDGRRDVIASTDAAMAYLSFLHKSFDDWLLVMAGYNAGEGTVRRALRRYRGSAGKKAADKENDLFWHISLPRETRNYIPRVLAYASVIANPERFGFTLPHIPYQPGFNVVELPAQYDLMKVASALSIPIDDLYQWNPALNQWATPEAGPHRVIVPAGLDTTFAKQQLADLPEVQRMGWRRITVASGDTLSGLANRHGTSTRAIRRANRLKGDRIRIGQALYIPKAANADAYPVATLQGAGAVHTVSRGDSLWSIARANNVRVADLVRWNELNPKRALRLGQQIHVGATNRRVLRRVKYSVRKGDSLSLIASRFNVNTADIARWNKLNREDYLKPGQRLTLHVNVAKARSNSAAGL